MDKEIYTDTIEAYLLNKLDIEDKIAFRQVIEKDPILKSELQFQGQIIEAIQMSRKTELKARLNAIQIQQSPFQQLPRFVWFVGTSILVGALLIAVFFPYEQTNKQLTIQSSPLNNKSKPLVIKDKAPKTTEGKSRVDESAIQEKETQPKPSVNYPKQRENSMYTAQPTSTTELDDAQNSSELSTLNQKTNHNLATHLPYRYDSKANKSKRFMSKIDNILESQKDTYAFEADDEEDVKGIFDGTNEANLEEIAQRNILSYQYYNDQLFLYNYQGSYKVIRTFIDKQERHFLHYEGRFYELKTPQIEKRELRSVNDSTLINNLQQLVSKLYGK